MLFVHNEDFSELQNEHVHAHTHTDTHGSVEKFSAQSTFYLKKITFFKKAFLGRTKKFSTHPSM